MSIKFLDPESDLAHEIWAMSSLTHKTTGLGNISVWVSPKFAGHQPRVKVSNIRGRSAESNQDSFSLSISSPIKLLAGKPRSFSRKELASILRWIKLNEGVLLDYWNLKLDPEDLKDLLKPV
jgi:hypothetical protein